MGQKIRFLSFFKVVLMLFRGLSRSDVITLGGGGDEQNRRKDDVGGCLGKVTSSEKGPFLWGKICGKKK